jgi:ribosomal protein L9
MANGDHISHNDNTKDTVDNNAKGANDHLFNAAYDNAGANAKAADNTAKVGDQNVVQSAATGSAEKGVDVSNESAAIQERFKGTPSENMAQSHEKIGALFASMTTKEGQDMLKQCVTDFCKSQAAHPDLAKALGNHAN